MKKTILCSVLIMLVIMTACSFKKLDNSKKDAGLNNSLFYNENGGKTFNRSIFNKELGTLINEKEAFSGLKVYDLESGAAITVCNVPGCLHRAEDKDCMAQTFPLYPYYNVIWGNHIVVPSEKDYVDRLVYMDIDGTNQKSIAEWPGYEAMFIVSPVLIGEYAYFQVFLQKTEVDEYGYVATSEGFCELYEVNMRTGDAKCIFESDKGREILPGAPIGIGVDKICINYTLREKNYLDLGYTGEEYINQLKELYMDENFLKQLGEKKYTILCNLQKKECTDISEQCKEMTTTIWNDCMISSIHDGQMEVYNLNDKGISTIPLNINNTDYICIFTYKDFALLVNNIPDAKNEYYLMAPNSFDLYKLQPPFQNEEFDYFDDESDKFVSLVLKAVEGDFSYTNGDDTKIEYISKEEVYSWITK